MRMVAKHKHIRDSSKPQGGLRWVVLHLSTSTSLCRSTGLAEGFSLWHLSRYCLRGYFFFLTYSRIYYCIYYHLLPCLRFCCWGHVQLTDGNFCSCYFVETMYSMCSCNPVNVQPIKIFRRNVVMSLGRKSFFFHTLSKRRRDTESNWITVPLILLNCLY